MGGHHVGGHQDESGARGENVKPRIPGSVGLAVVVGDEGVSTGFDSGGDVKRVE